VRDVSFEVQKGEVFALLGPNGAGKTTTVEILEGFRTRDSGDVRVLGVDPPHAASSRRLRERMGIVLQELVPGGGEAQFSYAAVCDRGVPVADAIDVDRPVDIAATASRRIPRARAGITRIAWRTRI
jgi:ABC-type cobalamin transport system ATPase subunit